MIMKSYRLSVFRLSIKSSIFSVRLFYSSIYLSDCSFVGTLPGSSLLSFNLRIQSIKFKAHCQQIPSFLSTEINEINLLVQLEYSAYFIYNIECMGYSMTHYAVYYMKCLNMRISHFDQCSQNWINGIK